MVYKVTVLRHSFFFNKRQHGCISYIECIQYCMYVAWDARRDAVTEIEYML